MAAQNRLKEIREQEGLTIAKLAVLAGVSAKTISRLEKGSRNAAPATKGLIIKALNKIPDKLQEYTLEDVFQTDNVKISKKRASS